MVQSNVSCQNVVGLKGSCSSSPLLCLLRAFETLLCLQLLDQFVVHLYFIVSRKRIRDRRRHAPLLHGPSFGGRHQRENFALQRKKRRQRMEGSVFYSVISPSKERE